ncbi:MAG: hypothetical protein IKF29_00460 [Oceanobacillus sp.]|nr:hypothetical protein [Oceanobacillus sp.]
MTFEELEDIIARNNIPKNVKLLSDSGWECCETDMDGVYYDETKNELIFRQDLCKHDNRYFNKIKCVGGKFDRFTKAEDLKLKGVMKND